jgi:Rod binding domain-containing protein
MQIPAVTSALVSANPAEPVLNPRGSTKLAEAAQGFESIMLRQFLSESMKPLLQGGPSGQVYGYLLTDSLASSLSKGGGLGLSSVLQAQLGEGQP